MKQLKHVCMLAVTSMITQFSAQAMAQVEIENDSFDSMQQGRIATAELVEGEMYAATFTIPQHLLPAEMLGVRVVMIENNMSPGRNYCGRFTVEVWEDDLSSPAEVSPHCNGFSLYIREPGNLIYSMETQFQNNPLGFEVHADSNNYQDLLFSSINNNPQLMATIPPVTLNTPNIRVGLKALDLQCGAAQGDAFPLMLTDQDGEQTSGTNYLYGYLDFICSMDKEFYLWRDMAQFLGSTPGDFVMRLLLRAPGTPVDMDMGDTASDMGATEDMFVVVDMLPDGTMVDMQMFEDMTMAEDMFGSDDMASGSEDMSSATPTDMGASGGEDQGQGGGDAPVITSVSPSSMTTGQSGDLLVIGEGFETGAEVNLNARKIGVIETRSGRITASVPADLEIGDYDVIVTNPDGSSGFLSMGFSIKDSNPEQNQEDMGTSSDLGVQTSSGPNNANGGQEAGCACHTTSDAGPQGGATLLLLLGGLMGLRRRTRKNA